MAYAHEQTQPDSGPVRPNPCLPARYNWSRIMHSREKKPFYVEIRVSTYAKILFKLEDGESIFVVESMV